MSLRHRLPLVLSRRVLALAVGAFALYALVGFLAVPRLVLSKLPPALSAKLHRPVSLRAAKANPFTLSLTLEGLRVGEKEGPGDFVTVARLYANAQLSSVLWRGVVLREALVKAPVVSIARTGEGTFSISDLIEELSKKDPSSKPARFSIANIRVERGTILLEDRPAGTKHAVTDLEVGIPFLSNLPVDQDVFTEPYLGAKVNGSSFVLKGRSRPFHGSRETALDVDLSDVDLTRYRGYIPGELARQLAAGRLDTKVALAFRQEAGKDPAVVLSGRAVVRGLRLAEAAGEPLVDLKRFEAVLASADPFRREVRVASVAFEEPVLRGRRDRGGGFPVVAKLAASLSGRPADAAPASKREGATWRVDVDSVAVTNGRLDFRDERPRRPFEVTLGEITFSATGLSTAPGRAASLKASAATDARESFSFEGTLSLDPLASEGTVSLTGLPPRRYAPYYEDAVAFTFEDGMIDVSTSYRWPVGEGRMALSGLSIEVKGLRARKAGEREDFLRVPSARVSGGSVDPIRREAAAESLAANGVELKVVRDRDGGIDLAGLVKEGAPAARAGTAADADWTVRLGSVSLEKGFLRVLDEAAPRPVAVAVGPIAFSAETLSTGRNQEGRIRAKFALNGKGSVALGGTVGLSPVRARLRVDAAGVELPPFAGYLPANVQLTLASGTVAAKGAVTVEERAGGPPSVEWQGEATSARFLLVDPTTADDFLKWDALRLAGMKAASSPPSFVVERMSLTDFSSRVELYEDGTLNVRKAFGLEEPAPVDEASVEAAQAGAAVPAAAGGPGATTAGAAYVRVDAITLSGGRLHVEDRFVKPGYRAEMRDVGGRITGLSSEAGAHAEIELRGSLESAAPLEIVGTFNPFAATSFADIRVAFRDVDLVPMTPYFVKYAGYAVQKGRLTMNVEYRLNERKLAAKNSFLVDQFTFGEKVDSPTATKLPVKLAVSLLKDPDGVIRLDVPISGSVDDPKFRIGPIVWKIVGNVLRKAVLSPFALLGRLGGGGEELSSVEFAPGVSTLDAEATRRLDALAAALGKRPALKLEVEGKADAAKDAEGLRRLLFERKVKARKAEALAKAGTPAASVDAIVVPPEEWAGWLEKAYRKEKFPKPRTALGLVKEIPPEEMEKLMLVNVVVSPDDLRQLALARASAVKERLLGPGQVAPERVFLLDPAPAAEPKPGESLTRAAFTLK